MRYIEIQLDNVKVKARLLDDRAPELCQALWDVLPIEDTVAHAQWSGKMFHTGANNWLSYQPGAKGLENETGFQSPGDVVYYPPARELAVAYGDSQFCWVTGNLIVSTVAVIEDDLTELTKIGKALEWDGAKKMVVCKKNENGKTIEVQFSGATFEAELYEDKAPKLVKAIWDALPFEGSVTNTTWSGQLVRLWVNIQEPEGKPENPAELPHPGDILFVPSWNGLRFVYGQGWMRGPHGPFAVPRVGKLHGDIKAFAAIANQIQYDAAKKFVVRRME